MRLTRYFTRDDGETELEVLYTVSGGEPPSGAYGGPPEDYDPGSAVEVVVEDAWPATDDRPKLPSVTLTDDEHERFTLEVNEDPSLWEQDDYDDNGDKDRADPVGAPTNPNEKYGRIHADGSRSGGQPVNPEGKE